MDVIIFIIRTVEIFLILYLISSFFRSLNSKLPFIVALISLVLAAILTAAFPESLIEIAKRLANLTYYSLVVGLIVLIRNNWREISDED